VSDAAYPLRIWDQHLLQTAGSYDLRLKSERRRSARDLARLFFRLDRVIDSDLFIEAGAKEAAASRNAKRSRPDRRVVAFEANPYTFQTFESDNPPSTGIEYRHLALSDHKGDVTFYVRKSLEGEPQADGHGSIMERPADYEYNFEQVTVPAVTLDDFLGSETYNSTVLWIDVEGAAGPVLSGATELMSSASLALIEVEDRQMWQGAWTAPQVLEHFGRYGMVPVARDFEYKYQYNLLFVSSDLLLHADLRLRLTQHFSAIAHPNHRTAETGDGGRSS
jgi:FkbM family methyltransferase